MAESVSHSRDVSDGDGADEGQSETTSQHNMADSTRRPQMSVSSDEVNYLVFRYLQECGFVHSAFSFVHESMLGRTGLRSVDKMVPPGTLLTFLQKGLQYVGIEESLHRESSDDARRTENDIDFSLLSPAVISSLTRENPPIQLNVPPAAAAAAVKARLEAQAKFEQEQRSQQLVSSLNGVLDPATTTAGTTQASIQDPNTLARQALAAQAAAAHAAAAMNQMQHHHVGTSVSASNDFVQPSVSADGEFVSLELQPGTTPQQIGGVEIANQSQGTKRSASTGGKRSSKKQKTSTNDVLPKQSSSLVLSSTSDVPDTEEFRREPFDVTQPNEKEMKLEPMEEQREVPAVDDNEMKEVEPEESPPPHTLVNGASEKNGKKEDIVENIVSGAVPAASGQSSSEEGKREPVNTKNLPQVDDSDTAAVAEEILKLEMHVSEVFMCAWNPVFTNLIATGSGDASARIWEMGGKYAREGYNSVKLLPHGSDTRDLKNKDVTTLEWASNGELLATGSYDGVARIWSRSGALLHTLRGHQGPIFSLKWNKRGNYLLSGSYDRTTIVWDVSESTGYVVQQFTDHQAPALDVDWRDNETFASCSTDKTVQVCEVGKPSPVRIYAGHTDEVNGVKWDPTGRYLASCSDDCTAKVWEIASDRHGPLYDFTDHTEEIYTLKWSPITADKPLLATASFDGKVMLWNVADGTRFRVFDRHRDSVYSVAFSPSGSFLASGSLAGQMYVWDIREGKAVKSYKGSGDIFEVAWNKEETRVAGCFSSNVVAVIDFVKPTPSV